MHNKMRFLTLGATAMACGFGAMYLALVYFEATDSNARTSRGTLARTADGPVRAQHYVVNLSSGTEAIALSPSRHPDVLAKYQVYRTRVVVNDTVWHQLRLGFFADSATAQSVAQSLRKDFPLARVAASSAAEWNAHAGAAVAARATSDSASPAASEVVVTPVQAKRSGSASESAAPATAMRVAFSSPRPGAVLSGERNPTDCDAFTAHPWDPHKLTEGVYWNQVPAAKAVSACRTAVRDEPSARNMFQYGRALAKSKEFVEAADWYQKAAEQGYVQAQYALGDTYEFGEGVEVNYLLAQAWYRKAADQGYSHATARLDRLQHASISNVRQQMAVTASLDLATQ